MSAWLTKVSMPAIFVSTLTACGSLKAIRQSTDDIRALENEAKSSIASIRSTQPALRTDRFRLHPGEHWLSTRPIALTPELPPELRCRITFGTDEPNALATLAQVITKQCHVRVNISPDALSVIGMSPGTTASDEADLSPTARSPVPPTPFGYSSEAPVDERIRISKPLSDIRYDNVPLNEILDAQMATYGLHWKYIDDAILIYQLETRHYTVFSIPTQTSMSSSVTSGTTAASGGGGESGSGSGVAGDSGSSQATSVTLKTAVAHDIVNTIKTMITPSGPAKGRVAFSPATGTLTVTDTPAVLSSVAKFVNAQNTMLTRQVLLNFRILTVTMTDKNSLGLNWNAVYKNLEKKYDITFDSGMTLDGQGSGVTILPGSSRWSGSEAMMEALAREGRVSIVTQPSITTLNMEPVPIQVARQTAYLAQAQTLLSGGTNDLAQQTLTPGSVTAGFNMNVMPFVLPDQKSLLLHFSVNLSTLEELRNFSSGDSAIELPELSQSIFSQKVRLRSGETLVLSGYEQNTNRTRAQGTGHARFWALGGGGGSDNERRVIVILITPVVLD